MIVRATWERTRTDAIVHLLEDNQAIDTGIKDKVNKKKGSYRVGWP